MIFIYLFSGLSAFGLGCTQSTPISKGVTQSVVDEVHVLTRKKREMATIYDANWPQMRTQCRHTEIGRLDCGPSLAEHGEDLLSMAVADAHKRCGRLDWIPRVVVFEYALALLVRREANGTKTQRKESTKSHPARRRSSCASARATARCRGLQLLGSCRAGLRSGR